MQHRLGHAPAPVVGRDGSADRQDGGAADGADSEHDSRSNAPARQEGERSARERRRREHPRLLDAQERGRHERQRGHDGHTTGAAANDHHLLLVAICHGP